MSLKEKNDIIYKLQDYTNLEWNDRTRISQGTPGSFLKTYEGEGVDRIYYKLSNSDYRGIYGHESVNELIASRLLDVLGIEHVSYLHEDDFDYIMHGIDMVLPRVYVDKIWEMIIGRWEKYEKIQNSK